MKILFSTIFLLITFITNAQTYNGPESAEYDYANQRWLISNTSSHQVLARSSSGVLSVFVNNTASGPYGIEIVGDTLFCCCGASIKGYLLSTGAQVFNLNIGASFLNGMTHDNSGNLIATDFTAKKIYKVNIAAQTFAAITGVLPQTPNGIIFDAPNNRCVFVTWGSNAPIRSIDMTTNHDTTIIASSLGNCDGITRDGQGRYYITAWNTQTIVRYDSAFLAPPTTIVTNLSNPADIFYNVVDDTLAIPNAGNNTVLFVGFPSTVAVTELTPLESFELFPNPVQAESSIHLRLNLIGEYVVEIRNIEGRLLMNYQLDKNLPGNELNFQFNVNDLAKGSYLMQVSGEGKKISRFFVVE